MPPIDMIGLGADGPTGLRPEVVERIHATDFLAGGARHLSWFPAAQGERFVIKNNLSQLAEELRRRLPQQRCVVLASGDPLFYGIGTYLAETFGSENLRVEPALSAMQLAFARAGFPWQDAVLASVHGRDLRATLLPLLGRRTIGLFTQDGNSPAAVASLFLAYGLADYEAVVGENLGAAAERVTRWPRLAELAGQSFAPLNYLILRRQGPADIFDQLGRRRALAPGIPDEAFERPENGPEVMTRQEVRSVLVGKCGPTAAGDTAWDIGAGLGTVSVELAVLRPDLEVIAVERDARRAELARKNRERFGAYNIRVLEGIAPEALERELERPVLVFIGGSGPRLPAILDLTATRLRDGGRLVANVVTLEHLTLLLERLREWRWPFEIAEIQVARSDPLAGLTGLKPQRGVFIVRAEKPGEKEARTVAELAIVTLTPGGMALGRRLIQTLGHGEVLAAQGSVRPTLEELFRAGRPLVCVMALGIVVRVLGPLTQDKQTEPPVVAVDEAGRFAVSVLGGHGAGANDLAQQVARALGAIPVITTASDALGLPAVDLIGRDWGWKIEPGDGLTQVAAAVVRGEAVAVWQTVGRRDWWQPFAAWPPSFHHLPSWPPADSWAGVLIISDQVVADGGPWPTVAYRPPTLVLGVGCRRGVPLAEIEDLFQEVCRVHALAPLSLAEVATVSLKAEEPGLLEFAARHGVPLRIFSRAELAAVSPLPTPSEQVKAKIGIAGVAEPAAMRAAGTSSLLVTKVRTRRVTMAVARKDPT